MSRAPDTLARPHEWRDSAACRTAPDPEIFFPVGESIPALQQAEDAKRICHRCPVMDQCLNWALSTRQDMGVLGGLDERERARLHGRRLHHNVPAKPRRTPAGILAERAVELPGGHMTWPGSSPVSFHGWDFTPAQLAWFVAYGVRPAGHLRATCGHPGCITAEHRKETAARKATTPERSAA